MPHQRSIGDVHASPETRKKYISCPRSVSDEACWSLMRHAGHRWVSNLACRSLIRHVVLRWVSRQACWSPMRHVGLLRVSVQNCRSPIGLRSGMLVSNGSPIRHVGIRWVSARSPIIIIFL